MSVIPAELEAKLKKQIAILKTKLRNASKVSVERDALFEERIKVLADTNAAESKAMQERHSAILLKQTEESTARVEALRQHLRAEIDKLSSSLDENKLEFAREVELHAKAMEEERVRHGEEVVKIRGEHDLTVEGIGREFQSQIEILRREKEEQTRKLEEEVARLRERHELEVASLQRERAELRERIDGEIAVIRKSLESRAREESARADGLNMVVETLQRDLEQARVTIASQEATLDSVRQKIAGGGAVAKRLFSGVSI